MIDDSTDVTSETDFYVNNEKIPLNLFSSQTTGDFLAYAEYKGVKSDEMIISVIEKVVVPVIFLTVDKDSVINDGVDGITFTCMLEDSTDVSYETDFYVNNEKIASNLFSSETVGVYTAYAEYQGGKSEEISIYVVKETAPASYTQKILVEYFTGTWCG